MEHKQPASWPDFGIAFLDFLREEPWTFILVLAAVAAFVLIIAVPIYILVPRVEAMYRSLYDGERRKHKAQELFKDD